MSRELIYSYNCDCFRGIYNQNFQLFRIGISKNFLAKQFIIDIEMLESGLRTYKFNEKILISILKKLSIKLK